MNNNANMTNNKNSNVGPRTEYGDAAKMRGAASALDTSATSTIQLNASGADSDMILARPTPTRNRFFLEDDDDDGSDSGVDNRKGSGAGNGAGSNAINGAAGSGSGARMAENPAKNAPRRLGLSMLDDSADFDDDVDDVVRAAREQRPTGAFGDDVDRDGMAMDVHHQGSNGGEGAAPARAGLGGATPARLAEISEAQLSRKLGLDSAKMQRMKSSFFPAASSATTPTSASSASSSLFSAAAHEPTMPLFGDAAASANKITSVKNAATPSAAAADAMLMSDDPFPGLQPNPSATSGKATPKSSLAQGALGPASAAKATPKSALRSTTAGAGPLALTPSLHTPGQRAHQLARISSLPRPFPLLVDPAARGAISGVAGAIAGATVASVVDAGLFMGRSFRACWGANGTLIHPAVVGGRAVVVRTHVAAPEPDQECYVAPLALHVKARPNPIARTRASAQPPLSTDEILSEYASLYAQLPGEGRHASLAWRLVTALWGTAPELEGQHLLPESRAEGGARERYLEQTARRAALSAWLERAVGPAVAREIAALVSSGPSSSSSSMAMTMSSAAAALGSAASAQAVGAVVSRLSGNQVEEAVRAAIACGDFRLATLVAHCAGSPAAREDLAAQLKLWSEQGALQGFDPERWRAYEVLAGNVEAATAQLDWKRCLGLYLWLGTEPSSALGEALKAYEASWTEGRAAAPRPIYLGGDTLTLEDPRGGAAAGGKSGGEAKDLLYHLLHVYDEPGYPLAAALAPATVSASPLSSSLAWHLRGMLVSLGVPDMARPAALHFSFAAELEIAGLWKWAVYVLNHLPPGAFRIKTIKEVRT